MDNFNLQDYLASGKLHATSKTLTEAKISTNHQENLSEKEDSKKGNESEQKRMEGAIKDDKNHIKKRKKDIEDNEKKLARLKKDYKKDIVKEDARTDAEEEGYKDGIKDEKEDAKKMKVSELKAKEEEVVQDSLTAAMKAAQELGNTKLADQIGNTITFFTREFVVGQNTD